MPLITVDVGTLVTTSTSATATSAVGHLNDATSITIFTASSAGALTSGHALQISQFDPFDTFPIAGIVQSSNWFDFSLTTTTAGLPLVTASSGVAFTISNVSFRGLRLRILGSANTSGEPIAYVTKQITV